MIHRHKSKTRLRYRERPTALCLCLGAAVSAMANAHDTRDDRNIEEVHVEGNSYTTRGTNSATGLNLSIRDTPQSVSVITQERIKDQSMDTIGDALRNTTGISVKATDRGRNSLSARGFDINNFKIDGVPFATGNIGIETFNTAIYERVEVVRGSTGLLSGAGDPSATVNLVRKHADSKTFAGVANVEVGSWDYLSGMVDVTTPLNTDGSVRSRFVAGYTESEAFIDLENTDNTVAYAIVDADLTDRTFLSVGASYEKDRRNGVYWGGLPYWYSDGTRTDWDRSATTATTWNQWDTEETTLFTSLEHRLDSGWVIAANASYYEQTEDSNLLWLTGEPDPVTGEGMEAYPYLYHTNPEQYQVSISATGAFSGWGYDHELTFRLLTSETTGGWDNGGVPLSPVPPVGDIHEWDGSYPEPVWDEPYVGDRSTTTQNAFYGAARLQLSTKLKTIVGARVSDWKIEQEEGAWTPEPYQIHHDSVLTPYVGLVYDFNEYLSGYTSYSSIFKPQTARDRNGDYLDPLEGITYELGLKGEFIDGKLNTTLAVFEVEQENYAVRDGDFLVPGTAIPASRGVEGVNSDGYEFEVFGKLTPNWDISLGWTHFSAKDPDGNDVAVEHPRKILNLFTKYTFTDKFSAGGGVRWQDEEPRKGINPATEEEEHIGESAYALVDLMARYSVTPNISLQLNANNLLDKEYKESSWGTFTYGEPRSYSLTTRLEF